MAHSRNCNCNGGFEKEVERHGGREQTMDVFEQLRWLIRVDAKTEEAILQDLENLANAYGGEKRALQLKHMMEDAMGL